MATAKSKFDGSRLRSYMTGEANAFLVTYKQFATLLPADDSEGAAHRGEDGRYVEALLRAFLRRLLPSSLLVSTGFILRPAVKTGINGTERRSTKDEHSSQLDILIYDIAQYPVFQRLDEGIIVPPEGVRAIVSVKKTLRERDIAPERNALAAAGRLCRCLDQQGKKLRGPFLALIAATSDVDKRKTAFEDVVYQALAKGHDVSAPFDEGIRSTNRVPDLTSRAA